MDNTPANRRLDDFNFGMLITQVHNLEKQVIEQGMDIKHLLGMAERSKGALWTGMGFASVFGGIVSWIVSHFFK
jgi:hypothetical protein